jgi:hypothetical protein
MQRSVKYLAVWTPDTGLLPIDVARAEVGGKCADGADTPTAILYAFHFIDFLCKRGRAHNQRSSS